MDERELRALVREAVERHLTLRPQAAPAGPAVFGAAIAHPSHLLLTVTPGSEAEGGHCVVEPSVRCNHCGFCQSFGH